MDSFCDSIFLLINQASLLVERHCCEREFRWNSVQIRRIYCSKQLDMNGKSCVSRCEAVFLYNIKKYPQYENYNHKDIVHTAYDPMQKGYNASRGSLELRVPYSLPAIFKDHDTL